MYSGKKSPILVLLLLKFQTSVVKGISYEESGNIGNDGSLISTIQTVVISFGALSGLIFVTICTWSWWKRLFCGRDGANEMDLTVVYPTPIPDPAPLPNIEPLPPIWDLDQLRVPNISSISDDSDSIHSQDWFEDPAFQNFDRSKVEYFNEIGRGWFGKVLEADVADISQFFPTIKTIVLEQREGSEEEMKFLNDARFYRDANHENILKLLGFCIDRSPFILIYQNWPLGDLKQYLITNGNIDNGQTLYGQGTLVRMAIEIAKGMEYMSRLGYAHGDLSARNCLVGNTAGKIIIGDYGLSVQKYWNDYYWVGHHGYPIRWSAPESLHFVGGSIQGSHRVTSEANIWTFGVVLWEIFELGNQPYPDLTNENVLDQVILSPTYVLEPPRKPYLTMDGIDTLRRIMLACWSRDPEKRPKIPIIINTLNTINTKLTVINLDTEL